MSDFDYYLMLFLGKQSYKQLYIAELQSILGKKTL